MLQTTDNEALSIQVIGNKKNQDISAGAGGADDIGGTNGTCKGVDGNIENLSTVTKSAKTKKSKLAKTKKLDNFSGTNFLTCKAKKTFIYLQKAFIKTLSFHYFDPKYHIHIKINASEYTIARVLS